MAGGLRAEQGFHAFQVPPAEGAGSRDTDRYLRDRPEEASLSGGKAASRECERRAGERPSLPALLKRSGGLEVDALDGPRPPCGFVQRPPDRGDVA